MIPSKVGKLHERIKTKLNVNDETIYGLVNQITQWSISERRPISEFVEHDLLVPMDYVALAKIHTKRDEFNECAIWIFSGNVFDSINTLYTFTWTPHACI